MARSHLDPLLPQAVILKDLVRDATAGGVVLSFLVVLLNLRNFRGSKLVLIDTY